MPRRRKRPRQGERRLGLQRNAMPVQTVFANLEAGMSVQEITEVFDVKQEEVLAALRFVTESLEKEPAYA